MKKILTKIKQIKNNKILRTIFKTIEYAFFALMILYVAFIGFQKITDNSDLAGYRSFTVVTGSMIPVYNVGDVILIKETPASELEVGDDVTYLGNSSDFNNKIITHRIIEKHEDGFITQGVNNTGVDPKITEDQIMGKVVRKLNIITIISNIIRSKIGFFFLIFIPLGIIVFMEVVDVIDEFKKDKE